MYPLLVLVFLAAPGLIRAQSGAPGPRSCLLTSWGAPPALLVAEGNSFHSPRRPQSPPCPVSEQGCLHVEGLTGGCWPQETLPLGPWDTE